MWALTGILRGSAPGLWPPRGPASWRDPQGPGTRWAWAERNPPQRESSVYTQSPSALIVTLREQQQYFDSFEEAHSSLLPDEAEILAGSLT